MFGGVCEAQWRVVGRGVQPRMGFGKSYPFDKVQKIRP